MKKSITLAVAVLVVVLLSFPGNATTIDSHAVEIDLRSDGSAHVLSNVVYGELTSVDAPYIVFGSWKNFTARDAAGELSCKPTPQTYGAYFLCKPNSADKKNYSVTFEFDVSGLIKRTADSYLFSYLFATGEPTRALDITLLLPEGTGIVKGAMAQPYSPDALVGSTGRRVTLEWAVNPVELGKTYAFTVNYEQVGQVVNYYGNYSKALAVIFALAFVFVLLKYKILSRRSNIRSVMDILKEDERKVVDIIIASKGKCKQKMIVQGTNFSKAKVSRILSDLEARGIIKKIHTGRTNRIIIADRKEVPPSGSSTSGVSEQPAQEIVGDRSAP